MMRQLFTTSGEATEVSGIGESPDEAGGDDDVDAEDVRRTVDLRRKSSSTTKIQQPIDVSHLIKESYSLSELSRDGIPLAWVYGDNRREHKSYSSSHPTLIGRRLFFSADITHILKSTRCSSRYHSHIADIMRFTMGHLRTFLELQVFGTASPTPGTASPGRKHEPCSSWSRIRPIQWTGDM
jgi:hypothetical protein